MVSLPRPTERLETLLLTSAMVLTVYTCDDHWEGVAGLYGDVGVLVPRLRGWAGGVDCTGGHDQIIVVLKRSEQCLPLVQFPRWMIGSPILHAV
jgi:hypothetical protein